MFLTSNSNFSLLVYRKSIDFYLLTLYIASLYIYIYLCHLYIYIIDIYIIHIHYTYICVCVCVCVFIHIIHIHHYTHMTEFSHSVMSDFLLPHGLQHARPPCPSPTPGVYPNSCPLSWWCHPTISSSVVPFSSRLQSFPVSGSSPIHIVLFINSSCFCWFLVRFST